MQLVHALSATDFVFLFLLVWVIIFILPRSVQDRKELVCSCYLLHIYQRPFNPLQEAYQAEELVDWQIVVSSYNITPCQVLILSARDLDGGSRMI